MSGRITDADFAALMAAFEPFEPGPLLCVAVSGGADSMTLALLADAWARRRRGRGVALTVDHRLRPESGAEARKVARWLRARGIEHHTLAWRGPKPRSGIQAVARGARYRLLTEWCRAHGVLHLLLGHNRDDQAETVLLRLDAGSGPFGLAAMPPVQETAAVRLLRPFLSVPRAAIETTLRALGQDWIEDPSNRDDRYARVRVRRAFAGSSNPEALRADIERSAAALGRFRADEERQIAALLARAATLSPDGYAVIDPAMLAAAPTARAWRALAAILATVGGLDYPPRGVPVRSLLAALTGGHLGAGRTLARCRLIPDGPICFVIRELRGIYSRPVGRGRNRWDGRFEIEPASGESPGLRVAALGPKGWAEAVAREPRLRATQIPYAARLSLPAFWDEHGLVGIPALEYARGRISRRKKTAFARLLPERVLMAAVFAAPLPRREALEHGRATVV